MEEEEYFDLILKDLQEGEDGEVEGAGGAHYASQSPLTHFFAGEEEGVSMVTGQNAMGAVSSLLQKQRHHALHASAFN